MRQAAQAGTQPAIEIELLGLACEAQDGVTVLHNLTLERSLREKMQAATLIPPLSPLLPSPV